MALENAAQAGRATQPHSGGPSLSETVGVLVNLPLETEYIKAIAAVDPRVRVLCVYEPENEDAPAPDDFAAEETSALSSTSFSRERRRVSRAPRSL